jgi:hypothetical protein
MYRFFFLFAVMTAPLMQESIAATGTAPNGDTAACNFQPPKPVLLPHAYAGQVLAQGSGNRLMEKVQLPDGPRIEIQQSACVDFVTTEFIMIFPRKQGPQPDSSDWIDIARGTIAHLKKRRPAAEYTQLNDFLKRAHALRSYKGSRSLCRDGSDAAPGECTWESSGGFVFSVKRTGQDTRVSVTEYLSG